MKFSHLLNCISDFLQFKTERQYIKNDWTIEINWNKGNTNHVEPLNQRFSDTIVCYRKKFRRIVKIKIKQFKNQHLWNITGENVVPKVITVIFRKLLLASRATIFEWE